MWGRSGTDEAPEVGESPDLRRTSDARRLDAVVDPSGDVDTQEIAEVTGRIAAAVERVIDGKPEAVRMALITLLAEGHLLIEDVPGVGKTMLAKSLAAAIGVTARRIQFTPDLMPSDVTGVSVFDQAQREFEFRPGAVFAHVVVGDEINRASPKTQSALLECMEEGQVSVDGVTYPLQPPFMVIATQNPIEMEGTYPLPEAQRDRFMAQIGMGYPSVQAELAMINSHGMGSPLDELTASSDVATVVRMIENVRRVHVAAETKQYLIDLIGATRDHPDLRLGASPRATLHLLRASRAAAALQGRAFVIPDDIQELAAPVLAHRLLPTGEAQIAGRTPQDVVDELVKRVPLPSMSAPGR
jgi:MoxR-like ATPase